MKTVNKTKVRQDERSGNATHQILVPLNDDEYDFVKKKASDNGITESEYVRIICSRLLFNATVVKK